MNSQDFKDILKEQTTKNIAIDFDGVIHKNSKGFHDGTIYDEPVEGTRYALKQLSERYNIIIYTCKARPDRPLVDGKKGVELIWKWLRKWDLDQYISDVTYTKPRAYMYIDDKGYRFQDWDKALFFIHGVENGIS